MRNSWDLSIRGSREGIVLGFGFVLGDFGKSLRGLGLCSGFHAIKKPEQFDYCVNFYIELETNGA